MCCSLYETKETISTQRFTSITNQAPPSEAIYAQSSHNDIDMTTIDYQKNKLGNSNHMIPYDISHVTDSNVVPANTCYGEK